MSVYIPLKKYQCILLCSLFYLILVFTKHSLALLDIINSFICSMHFSGAGRLKTTIFLCKYEGTVWLHGWTGWSCASFPTLEILYAGKLPVSHFSCRAVSILLTSCIIPLNKASPTPWTSIKWKEIWEICRSQSCINIIALMVPVPTYMQLNFPFFNSYNSQLVRLTARFVQTQEDYRIISKYILWMNKKKDNLKKTSPVCFQKWKCILWYLKTLIT